MLLADSFGAPLDDQSVLDGVKIQPLESAKDCVPAQALFLLRVTKATKGRRLRLLFYIHYKQDDVVASRFATVISSSFTVQSNKKRGDPG